MMNSWNRRTGAITLLASIILISACTSESANSQISSRPDTMQSTDSAEPPRIIALTSLTADITQQLDATSLVGIPGSRLLAGDSRFEGIEVVSSGRTPPNLEKIIALDPTLVIGAAGFHDQIAEQLEPLGIPILLTEVNNWDSLRDLTTELADIVGADETSLLRRYDQCLEGGVEQEQSLIVLVSYQPILAPNQNSWAGNFIQQFNFQNLMADPQGDSGLIPSEAFQGYLSFSAERLLQDNPDFLFVVNAEEDTLEKFASNAFWGELKATQSDNVYVFDYFGLVNPGSLKSIERTCKQLADIAASVN